MQKSFSLDFKEIEKFGFFVGDVIMGVGLHIFGLGLWAPTLIFCLKFLVEIKV